MGKYLDMARHLSALEAENTNVVDLEAARRERYWADMTKNSYALSPASPVCPEIRVMTSEELPPLRTFKMSDLPEILTRRDACDPCCEHCLKSIEAGGGKCPSCGAYTPPF